MPSSRPRDRIDDILTNIASIEAYTAGMNLAAFMGIVIKHLGSLKAACQRMQAEFDRGS